jgi:hypothetical protein
MSIRLCKGDRFVLVKVFQGFITSAHAISLFGSIHHLFVVHMWSGSYISWVEDLIRALET